MSAGKIALAAAFVTVVSLFAEGDARATLSCGGQIHQNTCAAVTDPYCCSCCKGNSNCTWWAWEMVCRNWNIALPLWGNANQWGAHAKVDPRFDVSSSPSIGSIATSTGFGGFGHVAWVVGTSGGSVIVTQEHCSYPGMNQTSYPAGDFNSGYVTRKGSTCACTPGQTEAQACSCGTRARTCGSDCQWDGWGVCKGDAEVCDGIDNDCNGLVDDGNPPIGTVHPAYAATLTDQSYPQSLQQGDTASLWAEFRNDGTATWPVGGVWLGAEGATGGGASTLSAPASWPAWNVAATIDHAVAPGEIARFTFDVVASKSGSITETFRLRLPSGTEIMCPNSAITPTIVVIGTNDDAGADAGARSGELSGCAMGGSNANATNAGWLALALLFLRKRGGAS